MSINNMMLRGEYWEPKEVLALAKHRYQKAIGHDAKLALLMQLANAFYAAGNSAHAQSQVAHGLDWLMWSWRAFWCLRKAQHLAEKRANDGLETMSVDELDIYARIALRRGRHNNAIIAASAALCKTSLTSDIRVILYVSLMQFTLAQSEKYKSREELERALSLKTLIEERVDNIEPSVKVRVYHALARFYQQLGETNEMVRSATMARKIAVENGFDDQIKKMEDLPYAAE